MAPKTIYIYCLCKRQLISTEFQPEPGNMHPLYVREACIARAQHNSAPINIPGVWVGTCLYTHVGDVAL